MTFLNAAYHTFKRAKQYYLTTVLTLSLTLTMVLSAFTLVDLVFFSSLPYKNDNNLYLMEGMIHSKGFSGPASNSKIISHIEKKNNVFSELATYHRWSNYKLADKPTRPEVEVLLASNNLFSVLGVTPLLGRTFNQSEAQGNNTMSALLGYRAWQTHFAGDPNIIGKKVQLNQRRFTVVGVLPDNLVLPKYDKINDAIWIPLDLDETFNPRTSNGFMGAYKSVVRLQQPDNLALANEQIGRLATEGAQLHAPNILKDFNVGIQLTSFHDALRGDSGKVVIMLLIAVLLLMLIALINLSSMQLAKAINKMKPTAISFAFGASKKQLVIESFKHNLILIGIAVSIALLLTTSSFSIIEALAQDAIQKLDTLSLSINTYLISLLLVVFIAALYTYIELSVVNEESLIDSLTSSGKGTGKQMSSATSHFLVGLQILFSFLVLTAAGHVVLSTLSEALRSNGLNLDNKLTLTINYANINQANERINLHHSILKALKDNPQLSDIATTSEARLPDTVNVNQIYNESGRYIAQARNSVVSLNYFSSFGLKVSGEGFALGDEKLKQPPIIINQRLADLLGGDVINKKLSFNNKSFKTIVGVVSNTYVPGSPESENYEVFTPGEYKGWRQFTYVITAAQLENNLTPLHSLINNIDSRLDIHELRVIADKFNEKRQRHLNAAWLAITLAMTSLLMVAVGINGIVNYIVKVRQYTMGVKLAMGANNLKLLQESIYELAKPIVTSLIFAFSILFFVIGMFIANQNSDVTLNWGLILLVWFGLLGLALITAFIPIFNTLKKDPIKALRNE